MTYLRYLRIASQIIFLGLFVYCFMATATIANRLFINPFFSVDPLNFLITSIATRIVLPFVLALGLVIFTIVFGRFFCGFMCPLGSIIDGWDFLMGKVKSRTINYKNIKYLILIFLLASALFGVSWVYLFDPLVIVGRSFTTIFRPIATFFLGGNLLQNGFVFLILLVTILSLGLIQKRFWCSNLCPLGGLLALFSWPSVVSLYFKKDCTDCNRCAQVCLTRAINIETKEISQLECIRCLKCIADCPERQIDIGLTLPALNKKPLDLSRRGFITSIGLGLASAPFIKTEVFKRINPTRIIRPPGSIPENLFVDTCVRCEECIKVCPTNGLQPTMFQRGVRGLFTPRLVARIGGCERNCNGCGQICPTQAIRKLTLEEKSYVKMGTAVIHKEMCLAWEQDKVCLICDEACPYNAIVSRITENTGTRILRPFILEELCTGCGICEAKCPIEGPSAIEVLPIGEERILSGSYITPQKKKLRERLHEEIQEDLPSGFIE